MLVGDGWVKDGDFNTSYSKTVLPLPQHGHPDYTAASAASSWRTIRFTVVTRRTGRRTTRALSLPMRFLVGLR